MKEIREILVAPHVTEETMKNMVNPRNDVHKYVFKVAMDASKEDIKAAIEKRFDVKTMGLKSYRPITPTLRYKQIGDRKELSAVKPYKPLTEGIKRSSGRNNAGEITSRRRGGGHKKLYRIIDFKRQFAGLSCTVETIEYDPNRTARIALVKYENGKRAYIIAPAEIKVGDVLNAGEGAEFRVGNAIPLRDIPLNTIIHNIEMKPGKGAQIARSAGAGAELVAKDGKLCQVKLPSGEVRYIPEDCLW